MPAKPAAKPTEVLYVYRRLAGREPADVREAKAALSDEALHQTYDDAVRSMGGQEEVRARHILVDSEDEAKSVLDQLKAGGDFATLAKDKSKDPGGAAGGDLGYFTKEQMVPEFAEVAFKMYPGQVSNPVKTQFGWHIIKLEDKRTRNPPEFEKVKDGRGEKGKRYPLPLLLTFLCWGKWQEKRASMG